MRAGTKYERLALLGGSQLRKLPETNKIYVDSLKTASL